MMNIMMGGMYQGTLPMNQQKQNTAKSSMKPMHSMKMDHNMPMNHSMNMKMDHSMDMSHSMSMKMPTEPTRFKDTIAPSDSSYMTSLETNYRDLTAAIPTNNPNKPVEGVINLELFGYMGQFIWFINGVPGYKAKPIPLKPGKRYRFVFTNTSMMHHPMHIHGHWFILRTGKYAFDPLKHTLDVPPGGTITADVDTDASGQWFFHCHMLYHMMTGMNRVFQYTTIVEIAEHKAKPEDIEKNTNYYNRPITGR